MIWLLRLPRRQGLKNLESRALRLRLQTLGCVSLPQPILSTTSMATGTCPLSCRRADIESAPPSDASMTSSSSWFTDFREYDDAYPRTESRVLENPEKDSPE